MKDKKNSNHCSTVTSHFLIGKRLVPSPPIKERHSSPKSTVNRIEKAAFHSLEYQSRKERLILCRPYDLKSSRGIGELASLINSSPRLFKKYRDQVNKTLAAISSIYPDQLETSESQIDKKLQLIPPLLVTGQKTKATEIISEAFNRIKQPNTKTDILQKIKAAKAMSYIDNQTSADASRKVIEIYEQIRSQPIIHDTEVRHELLTTAAQVTTPACIRVVGEVIRNIPNQDEKVHAITDVIPRLSGQFSPVEFHQPVAITRDVGQTDDQVWKAVQPDELQPLPNVFIKPLAESEEPLLSNKQVNILPVTPEFTPQPPEEVLPLGIHYTPTIDTEVPSWEDINSTLGEEWLSVIRDENFSRPADRPLLIKAIAKMFEQFGKKNNEMARKSDELFNEAIERCTVDLPDRKAQLRLLEQFGFQELTSNRPDRAKYISDIQKQIQPTNNIQQETLVQLWAKEGLDNVNKVMSVVDDLDTEQFKRYPIVASELAKGLIQEGQIPIANDILKNATSPELRVATLSEACSSLVVREQEETSVQIIENLLDDTDYNNTDQMMGLLIMTAVTIPKYTMPIPEFDALNSNEEIFNAYVPLRDYT